MEYYAGLDVSLKKISICVVNRDGKTMASVPLIPRASRAGFATVISRPCGSCRTAECYRYGCSE